MVQGWERGAGDSTPAQLRTPRGSQDQTLTQELGRGLAGCWIDMRQGELHCPWLPRRQCPFLEQPFSHGEHCPCPPPSPPSLAIPKLFPLLPVWQAAGDEAKGRGTAGAPRLLTPLVVLTFPHTQGKTQSTARILSAEGGWFVRRQRGGETHRPNRERHTETDKGLEAHTKKIRGETWAVSERERHGDYQLPDRQEL